jgi:hypothetical protein
MEGMFPDDLEPGEWLDLPEPLLRPGAVHTVSSTAGVSAAALEALIDGEVYVDCTADGLRLLLWPWYREQDEELRAAAAERAEAIGVELPPFLDEPFESAFYLQHTGADTFRRIATDLGFARDDLEMRRVPMFDASDYDRVTFEGGLDAPHPVVQRADTLRENVRDLDWVSGAYRPLARRRIRDALRAYADALAGRERPDRQVRFALEGPPEFDTGEHGEMKIGRCWAVDGGVLLEAGGVVVRLGEGEVTGVWRCTDVVFAAGHIVLSQWSGLHALDLATGTWLDDELNVRDAFGGPLAAPNFAADIQYADAPAVGGDAFFTPDAAYEWYPDGDMIVRLEDGVCVSDDSEFGYPYEPDYDADTPALLGPHDLALPGTRHTTIDGVHFTHRPARDYRVADGPGFALVLRDDRWRAFVDGSLFDGGRVVARVGVPTHHAAFTPDGSRLYVVGDTHLLEIDWRDDPSVERSTLLTLVTRAIRSRNV